jgi:hypothetical protein
LKTALFVFADGHCVHSDDDLAPTPLNDREGQEV